MAIMAYGVTNGFHAGPDEGFPEIDLDSGHRVITTLMEILQRHFKQDTHYARPMMAPQANIVFALDREMAENMVAYMSAKLRETGGFAEGDFRFTRKSGLNGEVLHRLRLEFPDGVTAQVIRRLLIMTDRLERVLPPYQA